MIKKIVFNLGILTVDFTACGINFVIIFFIFNIEIYIIYRNSVIYIFLNADIGNLDVYKRQGRQDVYDLTARQMGMLKVKQQKCFDKATAETTENAAQFNLETNENFFLLTKQSNSCFVCDYENGEKIVVSLKYL